MKCDFTVGIYIKTEGHQDSHGSWVSGGENKVKDINCDIQPYSQELLLKEYGYDIKVTNRIFCDLDTSIKIGTTLKYKDKWNQDKSYEVRKIIPWDDYMEVMVFEL